MTLSARTRARLSGAAFAIAVALTAVPASAAGSNMPWEFTSLALDSPTRAARI